MAERLTTFPSHYSRHVLCGRRARVGVYVISMVDCLHCKQLLSSARFRKYLS